MSTFFKVISISLVAAIGLLMFFGSNPLSMFAFMIVWTSLYYSIGPSILTKPLKYIGFFVISLVICHYAFGSLGTRWLVKNFPITASFMDRGQMGLDYKMAKYIDSPLVEANTLLLEKLKNQEKALVKEIAMLPPEEAAEKIQQAAILRQKIEKMIKGEEVQSKVESTKSQPTKSANYTDQVYGPGTYTFQLAKGEETGWISFASCRTSTFKTKPDSPSYQIIYSDGSIFPGNTEKMPDKKSVMIKIKAVSKPSQTIQLFIS